MKIKKIKISKNLTNKTLKEILDIKKINPQYYLFKQNNIFIPLNKNITKKTEIKLIQIIKD